MKKLPALKAVSKQRTPLPPATVKVVREAEAALMIQLPMRTMKDLKIKALESDMTIRAFVLQALKKSGVEVADETLKDRRK